VFCLLHVLTMSCVLFPYKQIRFSLETFFRDSGLTSVFQPRFASELHDEKRVGFGGTNERFDRRTPFIDMI
jgi:hypothetical protein